MAMNHIIRLATHEDLAQIVEIYNSTVASRQSTADLEPVSVASREAWFQAHQKPNRPIYVLANQLDNSVLAWASFSDYYARVAYDMTAEISLYVRHDSRGVGTGKDLLAYMLMKAPSLHIKNVVGVILRIIMLVCICLRNLVLWSGAGCLKYAIWGICWRTW